MPAFSLKKNQLFAVICLALALVTLAVYWPVTHNAFINYDDDQYITGNPHITSGLTWPNVVWAFQSGELANWHPLTWISHMVDCELIWKLNPGGHHLTNLLFHIANTLLLFLLLRANDGRAVARRIRGGAVCVASVARRVGGLGGGTQGRVERVFLAVDLDRICAVCAKEKLGSPMSPRCFFSRCGLMSKPMVVTLPFVLLLLDFWPLGRISNSGLRMANWKILLLEKIPFFALASRQAPWPFSSKKPAALSGRRRCPSVWRTPRCPMCVIFPKYSGRWISPSFIHYPHTGR